MARTLEHELVHAPDAAPARWLYVMHGIFGAGRNWASVVRQLVRERPEWGALLLDLRQHGGSQGFDPPHTIDAAAADVAALAEATHLPPDALLGHSFGGKVALVAATLPALTAQLRQVWVIDSTPDAREPAGSAWEMYRVLEALPERFASRDALIEELVAGGVARPVAQWMATNLEARDGGYGWRFDRAAVGALLHSFFETDAWSVVEQPPAQVIVHLVRATESSVMDEAALDRARRAEAAGRVRVHEIAGGHWVNADNPDALVALLRRHLPG
ncbi:MAG TPA: alpha/beta hydrolase [Longimicrobiales bacterium]|nr:alpha/beta hydrolase [Longimicrobiales bacterium]